MEHLTFGSVAPAPSGCALRIAHPVPLATGCSALLFLKMADEQAKPPFNNPSPIPKGFGWNALMKLDAVVSANLQRATRLRQSILQNAFTGHL